VFLLGEEVMVRTGMQTLNHVIDVLDCFSIEQPELGVRETARQLNLSVSTTGRLMTALKEAGVLRQNPQTRAYQLGGKVLAWAEVYSAAFDIRQIALPAMQELFISTQETISLYVLEGNDRVCVERLESPHAVRIVARIGRRLPLYAGSAGKLMLAFLPEGRQEEIIRSTVFKPFTSNTIIDPETLRCELKKIRQQGFAYSCGEWILEAAGVAAPILNNHRELQACLTISGPAQRFTDDAVNTYSKIVLQVAGEISRQLGCTSEVFSARGEGK
jgi:DNA-binding IclR family transcriptional regulator